MSDVKRLILSIVNFLRDQLLTADLSADAKESLEVAVQCLETAYGVNPDDLSNHSLLVSRSLLDIFNEGTLGEQPGKKHVEPSEAEKAEAERLKQDGNNMMKQDKFKEALECYTKAISIDGDNAVYYCNRAAAHSKLNNHSDAISDCQRALQLDPKYGKAYGRMGLAYASLNEHQKAKECYQKAVELDPENESYLNNLRVAEEKLREMSGMPQNPSVQGSFMNMASTLMQDPNMQSLMAGLMSGSMSQNAGGGLDALLQAGQQLAQQMQAANPELVEQLRRQMNNSNRSPGQNNPDPDKN